MCCDTGKRWHGTGFILIHAIFVNGKEFIMGYFSEMSLDMQEGRKPSAASLTRECAFEDRENFDELPVPPADRQPVPPAAEPAPQPAFEDDGDLDEAPEELEQPGEAESPAEKTDEEDNADEGQTEPGKADTSNTDADEEQRRAEHEAAEAKRKAEWEAKQAEKKKALLRKRWIPYINIWKRNMVS